ncbi:hypothetical protein BK816_02775 [Boudabousia tangfeifanii]|uniref:Peptidase S11 D-alanyl-D-alanine carboxypeptidase A N-terminal domain-containing protein n=1 Tax=Boudabousia tangfeifanii TaxID=1912795 RepID=A0A1D9MJ75_9ACTO|nr:hypothetical protein BK816_02775 [Boudabousia tangfeifanii]
MLVLIGFGGLIYSLWFETTSSKSNPRDAAVPTTSSFEITATAGLAASLDSGKILFSKETQTEVAPASLAKLFVVEYAMSVLKNLDSVKVGAEQALVPTGASKAGLVPGPYSARQLARASLIPSGSDAAYALAAGAARKLGAKGDAQAQVDFFMEKLSTHLKEQGFKNTTIAEPCGFLPGSTTTAEEALKITRLALQNTLIKQIVQKPTQKLFQPDGKELVMRNTNKFLDQSSEFYQPNIKGVKTGSLEGLNNLISWYQADQKAYIFVVLGAKTDEDRYRDTQKLIDQVKNLPQEQK